MSAREPIPARSSALSSTLRGVAGLLLAALACGAAQAERIEPPIELLHDPANLLVLGTVEEIDPPTGRVVFKREAIWSGNPSFANADELEVHVPAAALAAIQLGKRYVFGYTVFSPDPLRPGHLVGKRGGARVLVEPGLEPAAVFVDTPLLRRLLRVEPGTAAGEGDDRRESEHDRSATNASERERDAAQPALAERLDALLAGLRDRAPALQNLAATELAVAPELRAHFGASERDAMRRFAADPRASDLGRAALLEAAARDPADFGPAWALDTAAQLLSATPTGGFALKPSDREVLVRSALLLFDRTAAVELPRRTLERWLRSDSLALVDPALRMIARQDPSRAQSAIERAANDSATPPATRAFLRQQLEQRRAGARGADS